MNVLVISAWCPYPPSNGAKQRAYFLLQQLARRHSVTLLTFAHPDEHAEPQAAELSRLCRDVRVVRESPVYDRRDRLRGWISAMPRSLASSISAAMQHEVDRALPGQDVALGLTQWSAPYLLGRLGPPRVLDEIELTTIADEKGTGVARLRHKLTWLKQKWFVSRVASDFACITVVSQQERAIAVDAGCDPGRVAIVPNGVARDWLETPRPRVESRRLVYAGSVTFPPNLDAVRFYVTQVLPKVREALPGATLFVTGSTGDAPIADLIGRPGVVFTGHVSDVRSEVAKSGVCVVPLRIGGGTRLKILEALALGVPVVSTVKGAEGLELAEGRELLIADSAKALAEATVRVLADEGLAARLSAAGRRIVEERYTWEVAGDALNRALEESCR
jgi:glycosyltransferase involved in cell wall biosynthesis